MEQELLYQRFVGRIRLEVAGLYGKFLGSVYYQGGALRFQEGGLDLALEVMLAMAEDVRQKEGLAHLGIGPLEPVVPQGSPALAAAGELFKKLQARLRSHPTHELGELRPLNAVLLPAEEGLSLLREFAPHCGAMSGEESSVRLVLLSSPQAKSVGWDLMHRNGATHLGRWDQNSQERPSPVEQKEAPQLQSALEVARSLLEQRFRAER